MSSPIWTRSALVALERMRARAPSSSTTIPTSVRLGGCGTAATGAARAVVAVVAALGGGWARTADDRESRTADRAAALPADWPLWAARAAAQARAGYRQQHKTTPG